MKKKLLCCALLGAFSMAQTAMAQDYDDRWYVSGGAFQNFQDGERRTDDAIGAYLGFGKFISPNWSVDVEANYVNPQLNDNGDLNWRQYGLSVDARYHFLQDGRDWWPYVRMGLGAQRVKEDITAFSQRTDSILAANLGVGLQADFGRWDMRGEVSTRVPFDDTSVRAPTADYFTDILVSVGFTYAFGPEPAPPAAPVVEPTVTCADLDDDGDGINNCNDKCPGSVAGQAIGPDGCPVPLTIDLKGVNFDFDKDTLRPDAVVILDEAVAILKKYPQLRVEVAGHTDSIGTEAYNQGLSERRARTVYNYLTNAGIDAGRLVGPNGFGESRPIDTNDTREGRANNRRTELNVQN